MKYEVPVLEVIPVNFTIDTLTASISGDGDHITFDKLLEDAANA